MIKLLAVLGIALLFKLVPSQTAVGSTCYASTNKACKELYSPCVSALCYNFGGVKCDLCGQCTKTAKVTWTSDRTIAVDAAANQAGKTVTKPGDPCAYDCSGWCTNCLNHRTTLTQYGDKNSIFDGTDCVGSGTPTE